MSWVIADATLDRAIVDELEPRGASKAELAPDPALEHAGCALERPQRPRRWPSEPSTLTQTFRVIEVGRRL